MYKKGYIRYLYIGVLIIMVSMLTGCFKKKIIINDLKSFHYSYSVGYYMYANVSYDITIKDDKYLVKIKDAGMPEEEAREYILNKEKIKELEEIINDNKVYRWNGFDKSDSSVMDGNSFSISIWDKNGDNISAHGYMMYPKNYGEITDKIESWFSKIDKDKPEDK